MLVDADVVDQPDRVVQVVLQKGQDLECLRSERGGTYRISDVLGTGTRAIRIACS